MLAVILFLYLELYYDDVFIPIIISIFCFWYIRISNFNGWSACTPPSVDSNANWFGLEGCTAVTRGYTHAWIGKV